MGHRIDIVNDRAAQEIVYYNYVSPLRGEGEGRERGQSLPAFIVCGHVENKAHSASIRVARKSWKRGVEEKRGRERKKEKKRRRRRCVALFRSNTISIAWPKDGMPVTDEVVGLLMTRPYIYVSLPRPPFEPHRAFKSRVFILITPNA